MEGQSLPFLLLSLPPPFRVPAGHQAPCWETVVNSALLPGSHSVAGDTVHRAGTLPPWAQSPLMPCHVLNNVRTKELILAVSGPCGWGSGVTLDREGRKDLWSEGMEV